MFHWWRYFSGGYHFQEGPLDQGRNPLLLAAIDIELPANSETAREGVYYKSVGQPIHLGAERKRPRAVVEQHATAALPVFPGSTNRARPPMLKMQDSRSC